MDCHCNKSLVHPLSMSADSCVYGSEVALISSHLGYYLYDNIEQECFFVGYCCTVKLSQHTTNWYMYMDAVVYNINMMKLFMICYPLCLQISDDQYTNRCIHSWWYTGKWMYNYHYAALFLFVNPSWLDQARLKLKFFSWLFQMDSPRV